MSEHLPWRVDTDPDRINGFLRILCSNTDAEEVVIMDPWHIRDDLDIQRAYLIVRAVNALDALIAACEAAQRVWKDEEATVRDFTAAQELVATALKLAQEPPS